MAKFTAKSRYVKYSVAYRTEDVSGQEVLAVAPASIPKQTILGDHLLRDHERLDHLAGYYLDDPKAYWRIAKLNDAMIPDAAFAFHALNIPVKDS